jgi:hypothetical protein
MEPKAVKHLPASKTANVPSGPYQDHEQLTFGHRLCGKRTEVRLYELLIDGKAGLEWHGRRRADALLSAIVGGKG